MRWTAADLAAFQARRAASAAQPSAEQRKPRRASKPRVPVASEHAIHVSVVEHLRLRAKPGTVFWHCPNGELRDIRVAQKLKAMGVASGIPDILILDDGKLFGLELKRDRGGQLSEAQREMHDRLRQAGAIVEVAHVLDEALAIFRGWGVLREPKPAECVTCTPSAT